MTFDYTSMGFITFDALCRPVTQIPPAGDTYFVEELTLAVSGAADWAAIASASGSRIPPLLYVLFTISFESPAIWLAVTQLRDLGVVSTVDQAGAELAPILARAIMESSAKVTQ